MIKKHKDLNLGDAPEKKKAILTSVVSTPLKSKTQKDENIIPIIMLI